MAYKVVDIYKDLPRTNCGDCGRGSCFAFATAVYLEAFSLARCPHLEPQHLLAMQERLDQGRAEGEGRKPASNEQALQALVNQMEEVDLPVQARASGCRFVPSPPEAVEIAFLDGVYQATRGGVAGLAGGDDPTIWVKIFLLIYLTRANGRELAERWVAYRELPNTVSKSKSFEDCAHKIAAVFEGDLGRLDVAATALGGVPAEFGSSDRCFRFQVLPRVPLLLLFWEGEEEFGARASLLLDAHVLDYLDQEAIVFMAEAFVSRLQGQDLSEVVA